MHLLSCIIIIYNIVHLYIYHQVKTEKKSIVLTHYTTLFVYWKQKQKKIIKYERKEKTSLIIIPKKTWNMKEKCTKNIILIQTESCLEYLLHTSLVLCYYQLLLNNTYYSMISQYIIDRITYVSCCLLA